MTIQKTTTDLSTLKINYLTKEMYEDALENDEINENELYITPGSGGSGGTVDSTAIPTANKVSEFDSNAKMNSTDMTAAQVSTFVGNLNCLNEITDDMTSAEVEGFVNDVAIPGAVVADYIIEQGTSAQTGITWTYRKWYSGIAECWGFYSKTVSANTVDVSTYLPFPFTFATFPNITLGLYAGGADLYRAHIVSANSSPTTQARLALINNYSSATSVACWIQVHGTLA